MIVSKITEQAVLHKRESIQPIYARRWINEAMDTLASMYDTAKVKRETTLITTIEDEQQSLPIDIRKLLHVYNSKNKEENYGYDYPKITFSYIDTHKLVYLAKPNDVTAETETPEIHEAYHMILALYIASKEYAEIDPNHPKAKELMSEFYNKSSIIDGDLRRLNRKTRKTPQRYWG